MDDHHFIFAPPNPKRPISARKVHLRRLYDVLHICLQRNDRVRATRAWSILARCYETNWMSLWSTAVDILDIEQNPRQVELLRILMLQYPNDKEKLLRELVLHLIALGKHREALDELELYLPSFPYQDNPVFHLYAGLLAFYLAQNPIYEGSRDHVTRNEGSLRDAQVHFKRVLDLDGENAIAQSFVPKIAELSTKGTQKQHDSDEEQQAVTNKEDPDTPRQKRIRI